MRKRYFVLLFCVISFISNQSFGQNEVGLPIDFELGDNLIQIDSSNFVNFNGGIFEVLVNPYQYEENDSKWVGKITRNLGDIWAGSKIQLDANLNFSLSTLISMKVYTQAPIGTQIKLKIEDPEYIDLGDPSFEIDAWTSVTNAWETIVFDFGDCPSIFNNIAFMFDFNTIGDGSSASTFYFDDVMQLISVEQNVVSGCTYIQACNYNTEATLDDGSCFFAELYYDCYGFCVNDADTDTVCDELDNCVLDSNMDQIDSDVDGEGDLCDYDDGLGITDLNQTSSIVLKMIDVLGREVKHPKPGQILFYIYDDNRVEKRLTN
ncbi:MAG: hypothetical protein ACI93N_001258 [Flavobacteriaceae bacterium]|jgi:hypothetical protein